uniref:Peptidase M13 C-terminal domain-containing protein n=1 Tax=Hanusia phi TaxID=3032 RepID=A0A6T7QPN1_9CRYP
MEKPGSFTKCPCCNNPWSGADGSYAIACSPCIASKETSEGIDPSDFDEFVAPHENFYNFAIGGWRKNNPIPPEYPSWNCFTILHEKNQQRLKDMVDELETKEGCVGTEKKVADFWASCMDEEAIEKRGTEPLRALLEAVSEDKVREDLTAAVAKLTLSGVDSAPLSFYESPDKKKSEWSIGQLDQAGLGLPDRDYYFDEDKQDKRDAYKLHVAKMFSLLNDPSVEAEEAANIVFEVEQKLAGFHMSRTDRRDPERTYNKMSVEELQTKIDEGAATGGLRLARFFELIGKPLEQLGEINVPTLEAVVSICQAVREEEARRLSVYLKWHVLHTFAPFDLPRAFVTEHFEFFEKTLKGTKEQKPRWKRAMAVLESVLGEALGQLYVAKYFQEESKQTALEVVERVREALRERLGEVKWMSEETRRSALMKMSKFGVKIGYPDKWIDYSPLTVTRGQHFENVLRGHEFHFKRLLSYTNAATDRSRWYMTPQTINAYYHPSMNEIVFPAAILQPPFFSPNVDEAINYGAMGAVVGHEMTHGFDDQGRKYDHTGNMVDWWTEEDGKEYEERADVMVKQAEAFKVHGQSLKGKLTCGENIADLGGLKLAYRALCSLLKERGLSPEDPKTRVGGLTAQQRFFLSWAKVWAQNIEKEREIQLVTLDPHGPNEFRVNGPLSNIAEFHAAFMIPEGSAMRVAQENQVDIW